MSLSETQCEWLGELLAVADERHGELDQRSRDFLQDQAKRYEQYGANMFLSPKQLKWLQDIERRLNGEPREA